MTGPPWQQLYVYSLEKHMGSNLIVPLQSIEVALIALLLAMTESGLGRHISTLQVNQILRLSKMNWAANFVYDTAMILSKIAALLFLARIFPRTANSLWFNYGLWATFGLTTAWLIGAYIGTVLFCWPVSKAWTSIGPGHCGKESNLLVRLSVSIVHMQFISFAQCGSVACDHNIEASFQ